MGAICFSAQALYQVPTQHFAQAPEVGEPPITHHRPEPRLTTLLDLPDTTQREVLSWCPSGATANALLNTCRPLRRLRDDPAAAALLLLRCRCPGGYHSALASFGGCRGGVDSVVRQVILLLGAGPDIGGPFHAPPQLLHSLLLTSAQCGSAPSISGLLSLPCRPDVNGDRGVALVAALNCGPYPAAMQALLHGGAHPCAHSLSVFAMAAGEPAGVPALRLLLEHHQAALSSDAAVRENTNAAMRRAVTCSNLAGVAVLLTAIRGCVGWQMGPFVVQAARLNLPVVLQQLLAGADPGSMTGALTEALVHAATSNYLLCATILLDCGADVDNLNGVAGLGSPLEAAVEVGGQRRDMVAMLLHRGAVVTPAVRAQADAAAAAAADMAERAAHTAAGLAEIALLVAGELASSAEDL